MNSAQARDMNSENQLMDMLTEAELIDIQRIPFDGPNNSGIIKGIVSKKNKLHIIKGSMP